MKRLARTFVILQARRNLTKKQSAEVWISDPNGCFASMHEDITVTPKHKTSWFLVYWSLPSMRIRHLYVKPAQHALASILVWISKSHLKLSECVQTVSLVFSVSSILPQLEN